MKERSPVFPIASLNYLAIFAAALAGYFLGAFWYSPMGFGKSWLRLMDLNEEDLADSMKPMIYTFLSALVKSFTLALVIFAFGAKTFVDGATVGLVVGIGLISTSMFSDYMFGHWNLKLFAIQAGYRVCFVTLAGGILGFWR